MFSVGFRAFTPPPHGLIRLTALPSLVVPKQRAVTQSSRLPLLACDTFPFFSTTKYILSHENLLSLGIRSAPEWSSVNADPDAVVGLSGQLPGGGSFGGPNTPLDQPVLVQSDLIIIPFSFTLGRSFVSFLTDRQQLLSVMDFKFINLGVAESISQK